METSHPTPPDEERSEAPDLTSPVSPGDIGSASRSCLAILIMAAIIIVLVCLALAIRLAT